MIVSMIVAMDERRGIGLKNRLPWRLPADLKRFKELTMGHHLIMGRKTYESIGRGLPGRTMVVITRNPSFIGDGVLLAHSVEQAIEIAKNRGDIEAFIIGGGEIFTQALPVTDRIYLTQVHAVVEADTYFPELPLNQWVENESAIHPADEKHPYAFTYKLLVRKPDTGASS